MILSEIVERARDAVAAVPDEQRGDARRVVAIAGDLADRERSDGRLVAAADDPGLRVELSGLAELLGRRHAKSIVFASLARAVLAELAGEPGHSAESLAQADRLLNLQGL